MDSRRRILFGKQPGKDIEVVINCFVSMPYSGELNKIWFNGIQQVKTSFGGYKIHFF
jgi:hypothetical protein